MSDRELFASLDVEVKGPNPLRHHLSSIGVAVLDIEKNLYATFAVNIADWPNRTADPETMAWFQRECPEALAAMNVDPVPAPLALGAFAEWWRYLRKIGNPAIAAAPVGFDVVWLAVACFEVLGSTPFYRPCLDIRSTVSGHLGLPYLEEAGKSSVPREYFDDLPHTHVAWEDALEQGCYAVNVTRASRGLPLIERHVDQRGSNTAPRHVDGAQILTWAAETERVAREMSEGDESLRAAIAEAIRDRFGLLGATPSAGRLKEIRRDFRGRFGPRGEDFATAAFSLVCA